MRDVAKVKNRFEVKLDSSQVFFLFAGLVTFSALMFVLGVVVGKSRPGAAGATPTPVALLPDASPVPSASGIPGVGDRLAGAQPKATEEPDIPLGFYENLENASPNASPKVTPKPSPSATKTAAAVAPSATPATTPSQLAVAPSAAATPAHVATSAEGAFTVQVVAYNDDSSAQKAVSALKDKGFEAYAVAAQVKGKEIHRVRVGRYATKADAQSAADSLASAEPGTKPMVVSYEE